MTVEVSSGATTLNTNTPVSGFTEGSVIFIDATTTLAEDNANFFWDDTNNRLGIGTATPGHTLEVKTGASTTDLGFVYNSNGTDAISFTEFGHIQKFHRTNSTINFANGGTVQASGSNLTWKVGSNNDLIQIGGGSVFADWLLVKGNGSGGGLVGINEDSPDAMLEIVTNATTEEGLKIKGSASQTGALFNMVDSSDNIFFTSGDGLASSEVVWNEQGADIDFRVEGSGEANALFVQGSDGDIGIGTNAPAAKMELNVATASNTGLIVQSTDNSPTNNLFEAQDSSGNAFVYVYGTIIDAGSIRRGLQIDTTSSTGRSIPLGVVYKDSSTDLTNAISGIGLGNTDATNNNFTAILYSTEDTGGTSFTVGTMSVVNTDHTIGSMDADYVFTLRSNNALAEKVRFKGTGLVGINESAPDAMLEIVTNATTEEGLHIKGSASQTARLLTATDSSDNILAEIEADGDIRANNIDTNTSNSINIGPGTGVGNTSSWSVYIGSDAGGGVSGTGSGDFNVGIGADALEDLTTGTEVIAIGRQAGLNVTSGYHSVYIGGGAGAAITTQDSNVCIGYQSGLSLTQSDALFIGAFAGQANTTGYGNLGIGYNALKGNVTGVNNVAIGYQAMLGVTGNSPSRNTAIGFEAGKAMTTGTNNFLLGYRAGDILTTGSSNIIIGYDLDPSGATVSNELNIGGVIYGDISNKLIGINESSPDAMLEIVTSATTEEALHLKASASQTGLMFRITDSSDADNVSLDLGGIIKLLATQTTDVAPADDTTLKKLTVQRLGSDPTNGAFIKFSNSPGTPTNDFYLVLEEG